MLHRQQEQCQVSISSMTDGKVISSEELAMVCMADRSMSTLQPQEMYNHRELTKVLMAPAVLFDLSFAFGHVLRPLVSDVVESNKSESESMGLKFESQSTGSGSEFENEFTDFQFKSL